MTINIATMHLAKGENIHVISAQHNSDTQYYEWIWPKKSSGNLQTCTNNEIVKSERKILQYVY